MDGHTRNKTVTATLKSKHHHKPYLIRHFGLLIIASWLVFASVFGFVVDSVSTRATHNVLGTQDDTQADEPSSINSSHGFSLLYDPDSYFVSALEQGENGQLSEVPTESLDREKQISSVTIKTSATGAESAVQFKIDVGETAQAPQNDKGTTVTVLSKNTERLGGSEFQKTTYQYTTQLGLKTYNSYSLVWIGASGDKKFVVTLAGLQDANLIPSRFAQLLDTLSFVPGKVLGAARSAVPERYMTDALSPAVVKIYRLTCGGLLVEGRQVGGESCDVSAGSGFFVSSEGHIATNGHVVEYEAEDALISVLTRSPLSLHNFLKYIGLSDQQIQTASARPELIAAIVARIYDAPDETISFKDKRSVLIVALGTRPLSITSDKDVRSALDFKDTSYAKKAELLASNFSAKDLLVVASGDEEGFTSSDVALLKINVSNTPFIPFFNQQVSQNQKITLLGFPGDADNQLTDNNSLNVTATNGSISAIRAAAGSSYKLYQSDADASKGSSGGPVITEDGRVLGLLTYRFKNAAAGDAAKSYIRDAEDIKKLADDKGIALPTDSSTQINWENGLQLFSENRFSKANTEFKKVYDMYPPHRLVGSYQRAADEAIAAGHDVQDISLALMIATSFIGASGAAVAVVLIARHHSNHHNYKLATQANTLTPHQAI